MKKQLIETAVKAREMAYAPYSHYKVGAALLAKSGKIYTGCNVENASFTPTNCAERTAFFKAISEGDREFEMIAIVAGKDGEELSKNCTPCGVCPLAQVPSSAITMGPETSPNCTICLERDLC